MFLFVLGIFVGVAGVALTMQWLHDELGEAERRANENPWIPQRPKLLTAEELRKLQAVKARAGR